MPNQIQALAMLPKLSEQQLLMALQRNDGSMPAYAVMAELQARKKRAAGAGGPMPSTTVRDDMTGGGLQSLGMPPQMQAGERQFAGGGIVSPEGWEQYPFPEEEQKPMDFSPLLKLSPLYWAYEGMKNVADRTEAQRRSAGEMKPNLSGISAPSSPMAFNSAVIPQASPRGAEQARTSGRPGGSAGASGIRSIKASVSGPAGSGAAAPSGFDFQPIQLRSVQDALGDVPADGSLAEMINAYKAQQGDAERRRKDAGYEALIRAGLTMARTPGGLGTSIAAGGLEGLNAYGQGRKEASAMERERMKELAALQQAQSAQALQRYGIANATRFGEAGIADKNQDNRFNAYKTGVESADRRYAADAGVRAASISAAAREAAAGTGAEKYRMDMLKQLRGAVEKARDSIAKKPEGMMAGMSPAAKMKYEQSVDEEVLRTLSTMTLEYPEIMMLYRQMRGGEGGGSPAIIRGGALPPGAQVRE